MKYLKSNFFIENRKYIKTYENILKNQAKINDYVIIDSIFKTIKYFENSIGRITSIENDLDFEGDSDIIEIKYENIPDDVIDRAKFFFDFIIFNNTSYIIVSRDQIRYWSKNKEELEAKLMANKYNL